jgi:PA14 domain
MLAFLLAAPLLASGVPAAAPPQQSETSAPPYTFHVTTRDVVVDVIAVDGRDRPVLDLQPADLTVFDQPSQEKRTDRLPERIVSLSAIDPYQQTSAGSDAAHAGFRMLPTCLDRFTPHYLLAYHPVVGAWTPGVHQVLIQSRRRGVHLYYRHSYYVGSTTPPPGFSPLSGENLTQELRRDACGHPAAALSIGLSARLIDTSQAGLLRFSVAVDANSLAFASLSENGRRVQLDYAVCNFSSSGKPISFFTAAVDRALSPVEFARAQAHGFPHLLEFPSPRHLGMTRFLVRDRATGNIGLTDVVFYGDQEVEPLDPAVLQAAEIDHNAAQTAMLFRQSAQETGVDIWNGQPPPGPLGSFGSVVPNSHAFCGDVFELDQRLPHLPDFRTLDPIGSIYTTALVVPDQNFSATGGIPGVTSRTDDFGIDYHADFWVTVAGRYEFQLMSDDGALLVIDDKTVIDLDGLHTARSATGRMSLTAGRHSIHVPYYQGAPSAVTLLLWVRPPGGGWKLFDLDDFPAPPSTGMNRPAAPK